MTAASLWLLADSAAAACRYQSGISGNGHSGGQWVCTNTGTYTAPRAAPRSSGYTYSSGGGGGIDYGTAAAGVAAGAALIEAAPGIFDAVGGIVGGVLGAGVGIVEGVGSTAGGVVGGLGSAVGGAVDNAVSARTETASTASAGDSGSSPFNIFGPRRNVPCTDRDRESGCRNWQGDAADFGGQIRGDEDYTVDYSGGKRQPKITCDDRGCYTEYVAVPGQPAAKRDLQNKNSLREQLRKRLAERQAKLEADVRRLQEGNVGPAEARAALKEAAKKEGYSNADIDREMRRYESGTASAEPPARRPRVEQPKPAETKRTSAPAKPACTDEMGPGCESTSNFLDRVFGGHLPPPKR